MRQEGSTRLGWPRERRSALRVAGVYVLIGGLWILFSDAALYQVIRDAETARTLERLKGWFFVLATGLLVYLLITREVQIAERLRRARMESERFLATLLGNVRGMAYRCANDPDWTMEYMSEGVRELTGYAAEDLVRNRTLSWNDLVHHEDRQRIRATVQDSLARGDPFQLEYRIRTRSGGERWVWEQGRGVLAEDGALTALEGFITDVSALKEAERRTQRGLQRLEALRAIDLAITGSLDLRVTLGVVLDQVTEQLGVDAASVLLLQEESQTLEHAASRGFETAGIKLTRLRIGEGAAGRAARNRETVAVPDLRGEPGEFSRGDLIAEEGFASFYACPLIAKGRVKGVLEVFHRTRLEAERQWLDYLETLAGQAAIAVDSAGLFEELQRANLELRLAYDETIEGWSRALDLRDHETEGHSQRVTELTLRLARQMGMGERELVHVRRGALLHDIGKMGVADHVLLKPGPLDEEEWEVMRRHPSYAHKLLAPIAFLRPALDIPYCHHEKWDGSGYPRGLKGEEIPLAARVFAVVDVWDALRSDRPYRPAWPAEKAMRHIVARSGRDFDPRVVEAFVTMMAEENGAGRRGILPLRTGSGRARSSA